jgi:hypothetical protein
VGESFHCFFYTELREGRGEREIHHELSSSPHIIVVDGDDRLYESVVLSFP